METLHSFENTPTVVLSASAGGWLKIDFFAIRFAHVCDEKITCETIKRSATGCASHKPKSRRGRLGRRMDCPEALRGSTRVARESVTVHVNAKQFA